jgi:hypothetical protein
LRDKSSRLGWSKPLSLALGALKQCSGKSL